LQAFAIGAGVFFIQCRLSKDRSFEVFSGMTIEQFESWSLVLGIGGLILFMLFIVWDLAKESKAGRFGTFILFLALALGLAGFLIKTILVEVINP
jgi:hypothetical protein|tara:strand:- start:155 stop:439 length:285 start_codon:yes stop_codon:yes gene_type:complete